MQQTVSATLRELIDATTEPFDERLVEFFKPDEEGVYEVRTSSKSSAAPPRVLILYQPQAGRAYTGSLGSPGFAYHHPPNSSALSQGQTSPLKQLSTRR
jgi:hypothetical protein